MSQKWPFRGSERTFFPLRGLKKGGLFIAKGAAREKQGRLFLSFHPIIPFCCTLSDPQSGVKRGRRRSVGAPFGHISAFSVAA